MKSVGQSDLKDREGRQRFDLARALWDLALAVLIAVTILLVEQAREDRRVGEAQRVSLQTALSLEEDLSGRVLAGLDLHGIRLPGRDLSNVDLTDANLRNSDLRGANLSGASLIGTDLRGARLGPLDSNDPQMRARGLATSSTNLTSARLDGADLRGATMTRTELSGASFVDANLAQTDLSQSCHGESTSWPVGFVPPAPGVQCNPEAHEAVRSGSLETFVLRDDADMTVEGDFVLSLSDGGTFVYVAGFGSDSRCTWLGDFDDWKSLNLGEQDILIGIRRVADLEVEVRTIRLFGWTASTGASGDGCTNLGAPNVDWDPASISPEVVEAASGFSTG